jgi:hypothetical protein
LHRIAGGLSLPSAPWQTVVLDAKNNALQFATHINSQRSKK